MPQTRAMNVYHVTVGLFAVQALEMSFLCFHCTRGVKERQKKFVETWMTSLVSIVKNKWRIDGKCQKGKKRKTLIMFRCWFKEGRDKKHSFKVIHFPFPTFRYTRTKEHAAKNHLNPSEFVNLWHEKGNRNLSLAFVVLWHNKTDDVINISFFFGCCRVVQLLIRMVAAFA